MARSPARTAVHPTGNQNSPSQLYGPDGFIRPQRFVLSAFYALPFFQHNKSFVGATWGGWRLAGVLTIQSGDRLTLTTTTGHQRFWNHHGPRPDRGRLHLSGAEYIRRDRGSPDQLLQQELHHDGADHRRGRQGHHLWRLRESASSADLAKPIQIFL